MIKDSDIPGEILLAPDQVKRSSESRLPSAGNARQGLIQLLKEDEPRSYERAIVMGCYDGNAPFSQKQLKQDGQRWRCNLNFRGLEGTMDSARIPYYALFSAVPSYAIFKTKVGRGMPDAQRWNDTISEKFTCLLDRWPQFKWHVQVSQFNMLFEGWGPLIFPDDIDWRFQAIPARSFLVPQNRPSVLDERMPYFVVRCEFTVDELYRKIKGNEQGASARGWNVKAVQNAIKFGTKGSSGDTQSWQHQPWEEWQKRYKDKTLISSYTECDIIKCAHVYVREYTGKISHFIITESTVPVGEKDSDDAFLFRDVNKFDNYAQVANVPFQNTGNGTWHSVRGIGLKSYGYEEVMNRLNCRIVDNANIASGMVLQMGNASTKQKMQLMVGAAATFIPEGCTFQDHRLGGDIGAVMGVTNMLQNKLAQKIGAFNQRTITREDGRGEKATATEIEMAAAKEGSLSASQIDNYYRDLDALYSEVYRRVLISNDPEAVYFREECEASGVPMEALENMEYVRANRVSGYGSPQMRKLAMERLMQIFPSLPEDGKRNALNEMISSDFGPDKIEVFNPPMEEISMDEWMATMENDKLHEGQTPPIISGMDHVAHLQIHLQDAEQSLAPLQQAIEGGEELDPQTLQQAYQYVSALGEHCTEHLAEIQNDPGRQGMAKVFEGQLKLLTAFHGKLRNAVRSAMARQAQQQREEQQALAMSALDQAKLQREQQGMAIDRAKFENDAKIKADKAAAQTNLKRFQVSQNSNLAAVKTAEDIRLDRIKTAADIQNKKISNGKKTNGSKKK